MISRFEEAHLRAIYSVSWAGNLIASCGSDNQLKLFGVNDEMVL